MDLVVVSYCQLMSRMKISLVFINDKNSNIKNLAYLFKYDSIGAFEGDVKVDVSKKAIIINNKLLPAIITLQ